jgi:hypothetical protein
MAQAAARIESYKDYVNRYLPDDANRLLDDYDPDYTPTPTDDGEEAPRLASLLRNLASSNT